MPSLKKLKTEPGTIARWIHDITYPFHSQHSEYKALALEAKQISKALNALASSECRQVFDDKIADSLEKGDGWLHRWAKGEQLTDIAIRDPSTGEHITHPSAILNAHSKTWGTQWQNDNDEQVESVRECLAQLIKNVRSGKLTKN